MNLQLYFHDSLTKQKELYRTANTAHVTMNDPRQFLKKDQTKIDHGIKQKIEALISARQQSRGNGDFATADGICNTLFKMNVVLNDHANTTSLELAK